MKRAKLSESTYCLLSQYLIGWAESVRQYRNSLDKEYAIRPSGTLRMEKVKQEIIFDFLTLLKQDLDSLDGSN